MKIVLANLISNALKYKDPEKDDPFIKIRVRQDPEWVHIEVEDNGLGIDTQRLEKVLDLFYKANSKSTGSGLGLYIVQETLEKLGGAIKVESDLKKGSLFALKVPNLKSSPIEEEAILVSRKIS